MKNEFKKGKDYQLSLVFVSDRVIKKINARHLRHPYVTDVIAFTLSEPPKEPLEGEIYIGLEQAARQAKAYRVSLTNEILRLAAHGLLHVLGYDDRTAAARTRMLDLGEYYVSKIK